MELLRPPVQERRLPASGLQWIGRLQHLRDGDSTALAAAAAAALAALSSALATLLAAAIATAATTAPREWQGLPCQQRAVHGFGGVRE